MLTGILKNVCVKCCCLMIGTVLFFPAFDAKVDSLRSSLFFGETDLSEGKMASASSAQNGHDATNAVDGNLGTRWNASDDSYPQWWMVDLDESVDLSSMRIEWYCGASGNDQRVYGYTIEASDDRLAGFTTIADRTDNVISGSTEDQFIPNAHGRFVKITINKVAPAGAWAAIVNVKVYGLAPVGNISFSGTNPEKSKSDGVRFCSRDMTITIAKPGRFVLTFFDLSGRLVLERNAQGPGNFQMEPPRRHGVYIVSVKSGHDLLCRERFLIP